MEFSGKEIRNSEGRRSGQTTQSPDSGQTRQDSHNGHVLAIFSKCGFVLQVLGLVGEGEEIYGVTPGDCLQLIEGSYLLSFVGRIWNTVAEIQDSHSCLVGRRGRI